ncbi:hypothetical protein [Ruegeria lacuscaerulensis]|uniref:hypothetical protein n=1 Tax=Ruegeria lacuscaerulensis TaxID=55218 RepID=UPI00147A65E5|nr:hypothetical protein [Ruegeria lacuscaerulensis]
MIVVDIEECDVVGRHTGQVYPIVTGASDKPHDLTVSIRINQVEQDPITWIDT